MNDVDSINVEYLKPSNKSLWDANQTPDANTLNEVLYTSQPTKKKPNAKYPYCFKVCIANVLFEISHFVR